MQFPGAWSQQPGSRVPAGDGTSHPPQARGHTGAAMQDQLASSGAGAQRIIAVAAVAPGTTWFVASGAFNDGGVAMSVASLMSM